MRRCTLWLFMLVWTVHLDWGVDPVRLQPERQQSRDILRPMGLPEDTVHLAYLIPSNRSAQANAVTNLRYHFRLIHDWYRDQMYRNGFGVKSFRYEAEADGVTPTVRVVSVSETDAYLRGDIWGRTIQAAANAGIPVWQAHEVWILIPEIHQQLADGSITGGVALGAGFGSGSGGGVAMIGSERLSLMTSTALTDNSVYAGRIVPEIGPYPLVQDVSFPWFEGTTISSIVSSIVGALGHEMTHGFGMPHDFRNDTNFHGNLMANGLRGFRGAIRPDLYASDDCRLAYAQALALSTNRWFHPAPPVAAIPVGGGSLTSAWGTETSAVAAAAPHLPSRSVTLECFAKAPDSLLPKRAVLQSDETPPQITVLTSGSVTPAGGQLVVSFTAADDVGLAAAMLQKGGDRVGEMVLRGTSVARSFATPYYDPGTANSYTVTAYDLEGNRTEVSTTVTPQAGPNRGPRPFFLLHRSVARTNQQVQFDGSLTSDPDSSSLLYEWDFDGNGTYDTPPTSAPTTTRTFPVPGTYPARLRVTDPASAQSVSTSIPLRILPLAGPGTVDLLTLRKSAVTLGNLTLTWTASCRPEAGGYAIYVGSLGDFYSHTKMACTDQLQEDVPAPAFDAYYLVAPLGGTVEGSYGTNSDGNELPVGIDVCSAPQTLSPCPASQGDVETASRPAGAARTRSR